MKNKSAIFSKVPSSAIFFILVAVFFIKVIIYFLVKGNFINIGLGGGSDANYYHAYAIGTINIELNIWPVMLRYINSLGFYSREIISYFLFFLNIAIIPILTVTLTGLTLRNHQKYYLSIFLIAFIYPTLFYFTFDIYRDVFMVFSFLLGCLVVKKSLCNSSSLFFVLYLGIAIAIGVFLLKLRPYLGYAFLLSLLLWKIRFSKKRILFLGIVYFLVLFAANYIGLLNELTEYRSGFEESEGGSTLGLNFSNPIMFIPNFILSFLGQMLGLYVTNPFSILLLFVETLPFFFMLVFIIKNIKLADNFIRFLIIFFVLYASVWLIGNDNLGTAVRLRMYNYLVVYISFFYILRLKHNNRNNMS